MHSLDRPPPINLAEEAMEKSDRRDFAAKATALEIDTRRGRPVWAAEPPRKWFSANDYPREMATRRAESVVKARLLVDVTGRVSKCTSLSHFEKPQFNEVVCKTFMERGHFQPAELADGTKVPSYYVARVVFRMAP